MSARRNNILLIAVLIILSIAVYSIQMRIFHQAGTTEFYFLQDLAFVPVQIIVVTIILNKLLSIVETKQKAKKINVIISTFFVDAGISIQKSLAEFNGNNQELERLIGTDGFDKKRSDSLKKQVRSFPYTIQVDPDKLDKLAQTLDTFRNHTLNMLGNENLFEHDSFTDMLWAVFHVGDELKTRGNFQHLEEADASHLANDILRAYTAMNVEWINYMNYLHQEYPFLFNLAVRKNPFSAEV